MKKFLNKIIEDLVFRYKPYADELFWREKRFRWMKNKNIRLAEDVYIDPSVTLDANFQGKIIIGSRTKIRSGVLLIAVDGNIEIGKKCEINPYTIIYGLGKGTVIGDSVLIAGSTMLISNNHVFTDRNKTIIEQGEESKGIVIEEDVWIGHGCSILDGVTIGKGAIVGAGSVVTANIPSYAIAYGVPAKIVRYR